MQTSLLALSLVLALAGAFNATSTARADGRKQPVDRSIHSVTLAVIGDSPYGASQVTDLPNLVAAINADPDVKRVVADRRQRIGGISAAG